MKSWRDVLPIHPAAELFPPLPPDELRALGEDIRKHGLTSPIAITVTKLPIGWKYELLDGINRLDGVEAISIPFRIETGNARCTVDLTDSGIRVDDIRRLMSSATVIETDPQEYVISANIRRRHLSIEEKNRLIIHLLKADPTKSNRAVAKLTDTSHPHVAKVREQAEKTGDVETVTTSIDTKGRRQPASKGNRSRVSVPQRTPAEGPNCTDKISLDGFDEVEHLPARNEELENTSPELEPERSALPSWIEPLRGPTIEESGSEASELNDLLRAWDRASETARRAFAARVGLQRVDVA